MLVEIVDGAVDRAPKLIDRGNGPQAVAPEVEEIVLAGDGRAFQALRPHLRDALFHPVARLSAPTVDAARFGGVGFPLGNHAQQRRSIHLAGGGSETTRNSAARSTLPEVFTGMAGTRITAAGSMQEGSVLDR